MFLPSCFSIFLCVMTCLSLTLRKKTLKPSKRMFQCPGWMIKNFIPRDFSWRVATETWDASFFKKGLLEKQQSVSNTCAILALKKIFYQNFTDAFFKIHKVYFILKVLVIPKIFKFLSWYFGHVKKTAWLER